LEGGVFGWGLEGLKKEGELPPLEGGIICYLKFKPLLPGGYLPNLSGLNHFGKFIKLVGPIREEIRRSPKRYFKSLKGSLPGEPILSDPERVLLFDELYLI